MNPTQAAAERLLKGARAYRDGTYNQQLDLQNVADAHLAYLETVPADDGEPLDWDFLASVGFVDDDEMEESYVYLPELRKRMPALIVDHESGDWSIGTLPIVTPKTRGEVRRLLAALGVET